MRALPVILTVLVCGCLDLRDPFDADSCRLPAADVMVGVRGTEEVLRTVRLRADHGMSAMLSCVGPAWEESGTSDNGATVRMQVDAQVFEAATLEFERSLVRVGARIPAEENGSLIIDLGSSEPSMRWNGAALKVERHERFTDPRTLDAVRMDSQWAYDESIDRTERFLVNSSWNQGVLTELFSYDDRPDDDVSPRGRIDLIAPNGTIRAFDAGPGGYGLVEARQGPLAVGEWQVRIRSDSPTEGADHWAHFRLWFDY